MTFSNSLIALGKLSTRRPLFIFGSLVFTVFYFLTDVTFWFHDFSYVFLTTLIYFLVIPYAISKQVNLLLLFILGILPLISSLTAGFPSSFISSFQNYPSDVISEFNFDALWLLVGLLPAISLFFLSFISINGNLFNLLEKIDYLDKQKEELSRFTKIFNLVVIVYLLSELAGDLPVISYFVRTIFFSLSWYFFFIGLFKEKLGSLNFKISITLLLIHTLVVFLSGGRYSAIWLNLLFLLGYYISSTKRTRFIIRLNLLWIIPIAIFIVGVVGIIRQDVGRGTLAIISQGDHFSQMKNNFFNSIGRYFSDSGFRSDIYDEMASRTKGGGALQTVLLYTPNKIDYRSWDNISVEISAITKIGALQAGGFDLESLTKARESQIENDLSTAAANRYGFYVTGGNSVEWPLVADGYSRFGLLGVLIYNIIFIIWFSFLFRVMQKIFNSNLSLVILLLTYTSLAFDGYNSKPLYDTIRGSLLYSIPIGCILIFFPRKSIF